MFLCKLETSHLEENKVAEGFSVAMFKRGSFPKESVSVEHVFGGGVSEMQMNRRGCLC